MRRIHVFRRLLPVLLPAILFISCGEKDDADEPLPKDPISISAKLSKSVMYLGENSRLEITAVYQEDVVVEFPDQVKMTDGLEIVDSGKTVPDNLSGGMIEEGRWYEITTTVPGDYNISGLVIEYSDREGRHDYITGALELKVMRTVEDVTTIKHLRDIKPPKAIAKNYRRLFVFLSCLAAGAMFIVLVYMIVSRRRRKQIDEEETVPPNVKALAELSSIEEKGFPEDGKHTEFIVLISSVVRHYIEERFSVSAEEMTTEEFMRRADKGYYLSDESRGLIGEFLEQCDTVKFAAHSPTNQECSAVFEKAIEFIEKSC